LEIASFRTDNTQRPFHAFFVEAEAALIYVFRRSIRRIDISPHNRR
jgi:hypothetical protein